MPSTGRDGDKASIPTVSIETVERGLAMRPIELGTTPSKPIFEKMGGILQGSMTGRSRID